MPKVSSSTNTVSKNFFRLTLLTLYLCFVAGKSSLVYDIAINSTFYGKVETNQLFRSFLLTVALEGVAHKYSKEIDTNGEKHLS